MAKPNDPIMNKNLIYFLLLGIFLSILACGKEEITTDPTPPISEPPVPEKLTCNLEKVYKDGELSQSIEVFSNSSFKITHYEAGNISLELVYEKDSDNRITKQTFNFPGSESFYGEYKYLGSNTFPDTVNWWIMENGVPQFADYYLHFYDTGSCNLLSLIESYTSSGTLRSYTEYNYSGENCSGEGQQFLVENGEEELWKSLEFEFDSEKSPYLSYSLSYDNPHNRISSSSTSNSGTRTYNNSYEYNEHGYPISNTQTYTSNTGEVTTSEFTYEYSCQ